MQLLSVFSDITKITNLFLKMLSQQNSRGMSRNLYIYGYSLGKV